MTAFLAYSYSANLTRKEQTEINEKTKKSREEFTEGFTKGTSFLLVVYSLYSLTTSAAYAADSNVPAPGPKTPGDTGAIPPTPKSTPGFKSLSEGTKNVYVGGATAICGTALQNGNFLLGLTCAFLLVVGGIVINRS